MLFRSTLPPSFNNLSQIQLLRLHNINIVEPQLSGTYLSLRSLRLEDVAFPSPRALINFLQNAPRLQYFAIRDFRNLDSDIPTSVLPPATLPSLMHLNIQQTNNFTVFGHILEHLLTPSLVSLHINSNVYNNYYYSTDSDSSDSSSSDPSESNNNNATDKPLFPLPSVITMMKSHPSFLPFTRIGIVYDGYRITLRAGRYDDVMPTISQRTPRFEPDTHPRDQAPIPLLFGPEYGNREYNRILSELEPLFAVEQLDLNVSARFTLDRLPSLNTIATLCLSPRSIIQINNILGGHPQTLPNLRRLLFVDGKSTRCITLKAKEIESNILSAFARRTIPLAQTFELSFTSRALKSSIVKALIEGIFTSYENTFKAMGHIEGKEDVWIQSDIGEQPVLRQNFEWRSEWKAKVSKSITFSFWTTNEQSSWEVQGNSNVKPQAMEADMN